MKGRTEAVIMALSIFFLSNKFMSFVSFIYYKNRNLKYHKIHFNKLLVFPCERRNYHSDE
jgi:hypothetical protein